MGTNATNPQELYATHQHADVNGAYPTDFNSREITQEELDNNKPVYAGGYYA